VALNDLARPVHVMTTNVTDSERCAMARIHNRSAHEDVDLLTPLPTHVAPARRSPPLTMRASFVLTGNQVSTLHLVS
jgi:hypothetical protein